MASELKLKWRSSPSSVNTNPSYRPHTDATFLLLVSADTKTIFQRRPPIHTHTAIITTASSPKCPRTASSSCSSASSSSSQNPSRNNTALKYRHRTGSILLQSTNTSDVNSNPNMPTLTPIRDDMARPLSPKSCPARTDQAQSNRGASVCHPLWTDRSNSNPSMPATASTASASSSSSATAAASLPAPAATKLKRSQTPRPCMRIHPNSPSMSRSRRAITKYCQCRTQQGPNPHLA